MTTGSTFTIRASKLVVSKISALGRQRWCRSPTRFATALNICVSSDNELIELAQRELIKIGLAREGDLVDGCVVRQKKAYPVYDDDYARHVATVRQELDDRYPNLHLVGRNGMHKYNNQDHAMMTSMLCVENILADTKLYDLWQVNADAEYHEAGAASTEETIGTGLRLVPTRVVAAPELAPEG